MSGERFSSMKKDGEMPLVSIVTPSFNQGRYLEETILSVLSQDYANLEYIIIDGGSTDGSVEIIRKYDDRVAYWISEPDNGQADAINKGWRLSKGEILAYLNADDTYEPDAVKRGVEAFRAYPEAYLVYGDLNYVDEEGGLLRCFRAPDFAMRSFVGESCYVRQPTTFFKRAALDQVGMLDARLQYAMDYDLFIRICARFPVRRIAGVIANFRVHPRSKTGSASNNRGENAFWPEERLLLERVAQDGEFLPAVRGLAWRRIGISYYASRNMTLARQMFIRAMRTYGLLCCDRSMVYLFVKSLLGGRIVERVSQIKAKLAADSR